MPLLLPLLDSITAEAWPLVDTLEGFPPEAVAFAHSLRAQEPIEQPFAEGSGWWAVFGGLDVSFLDEAEDIQTPRARGLFFIVAPP